MVLGFREFDSLQDVSVVCRRPGFRSSAKRENVVVSEVIMIT